MKKEPIRILQFIGSLNSGGSQSMIMNIYRNIDRNKIQFDFIVDRKDELLYKDEIEQLGGKVYIFNYHFTVLNYFRYKKQWNKFFAEHKEYKTIHCHVRSVASIVLKIAKKNGLKTICHSHSTSNGNGFSSLIKKELQKNIPKYSDYLFACSNESAIWLYGDENTKSNRCYIINNAIDSIKFVYNSKIRNQVRNKLDLDNKIVLGIVGRLEEVKNHKFAIQVLNELIKCNNNYYLLVIGTGNLKEELIKQINKDRLSNNVIFLENRNDVNELLQAMDIYIMPSLWEGLPLSLVEAQAASLPCVISSNVLDGIIIDDLVKKISLESIDEWVDFIKNIDLTKERVNQYQNVVDSGFDIKKNVKMITDFYLSL